MMMIVIKLTGDAIRTFRGWVELFCVVNKYRIDFLNLADILYKVIRNVVRSWRNRMEI